MMLRLIGLFSSWWMTAAIMLGIAASYIYYSYGTGTYDKWADFLLRNPAGLAMYSGLMGNLLVAGARAAVLKLRRETITPEAVKGMDTYIKVPLRGPEQFGAVVERVMKMGFRMEAGAAEASGHKGRLSFLPGTALRVGIVVLMAALALSASLRTSEEATFYPSEPEASLLGRKFRLLSTSPNLPEAYVQAGESGSFRPSGILAKFVSGGSIHTVTSGATVKAEGMYLRITYLGLVQPIWGRTQKATFDWSLLLDVLPPGRTDSDVMLSPELSLSFVLKPQRPADDGLTAGKLYNLRKPTYGISLLRGEGSGDSETITLRPGEISRLGEADITLGEPSVYLRVLAFHDPALAWIYGGLALSLAGLLLMPSRFFWYERHVYAFRTYEAVLVGYREEFFKKRGVKKFEELREELSSGAQPKHPTTPA